MILSFLGELIFEFFIVGVMESIRNFLFHRHDPPEPDESVKERLDRLSRRSRARRADIKL